jgi:hypothetical protein
VFDASIEKPIENQTIITKTGETGPNRFHQFLVNRQVKLIFLEKLKNKYFLKKLEAISRFLVKTEFKNSKSIDLQNSEKRKPKEKSEK